MNRFHYTLLLRKHDPGVSSKLKYLNCNEVCTRQIPPDIGLLISHIAIHIKFKLLLLLVVVVVVVVVDKFV